MGTVLNETLEGHDYYERIEVLKQSRIGLWDVYRSCVRPGSMDKNITDPQLNSFSQLKLRAPKLTLVCFNGKKAGKSEGYLRRLGYVTRVLPSSSGANRRVDRLQTWKDILREPE
jgi:double-stranded uracil-DNA glycosylase